MSTLDGAVPLGLGIATLRLWDELQRKRGAGQQSDSREALFSSDADNDDTDVKGKGKAKQVYVHPEYGSSSRNTQQIETSTTNQAADEPATSGVTQQTTTGGAVCWDEIFAQAGCLGYSPELDDPLQDQDHVLDWMLSFQRKAPLPHKDSLESITSRHAGPSRLRQAAPVPPPPQPKPGPSRQKPPSIAVRTRARARRAKRKQQKAEYRRRLFLSQLVEDTRQARQGNASCAAQPIGRKRRNSVHSCSSKCWMDEHVARQAPIRFPECAGLDLDRFVEVVFDTDAQSTEVTAPSEVSDEDLARVTRREIELRRAFMGADVVVPKGVYRWMVARDFAERYPYKVRHVRDNPWPGLEKVWGEPSSRRPSQPGDPAEPEPIRWQSGPRSRFIIRRKAQRMAASHANRMRASTMPGVAFDSTVMLSQQASSSATFAGRWLPPTTGTSFTTTPYEQASSSTTSAAQQIPRVATGSSSTMLPSEYPATGRVAPVPLLPVATSESTANPQTMPFPPVLHDTTESWQ